MDEIIKPKHPGGRPSSYKLEYCDAIIEYFDIEPYTMKQTVKGYEEIPNDLPLFEGFAVSIGVHRETLINWSNEYAEFFDAYKMAKDLQKKMLITNALRGNYNNTFAIFTAKNITDMRDEIIQKYEIEENVKKKLKDQFDGAFGKDS